MNIETRSIDSLRSDPRNARKHGKKNLATIRASLQQFGQRRAAVIRSDGTVLAGNGMLEAARSMGWTELSVTVVPDEWSDEEARAYALADNRTGELAEWDVAVLDEHLVELEVAGLDIEALGFEPPKREDVGAEEEEVPEVPANPLTRLGDLWQVGPHRIICGDSTDANAYQRLMGDTRADFVFTDPPYGVDIQGRDSAQTKVGGRRKDGKGVLNDSINRESLSELLRDSFSLAVAQCRAGASWYVCSPQGELLTVFANTLRDFQLYRHSLVWIKNSFVMGRADYHYRHEVIFYGWVPGAAHDWYSDRKQDSVWEFDRPSRSPEHPTMKPVELVAYAMSNSSKRGDIVLDPFCGSGTTLVAAAQTGRVGYGIELDPAYVDVIVGRLERETGETAVRVDG